MTSRSISVSSTSDTYDVGCSNCASDTSHWWYWWYWQPHPYYGYYYIKWPEETTPSYWWYWQPYPYYGYYYIKWPEETTEVKKEETTENVTFLINLTGFDAENVSVRYEGSRNTISVRAKGGIFKSSVEHTLDASDIDPNSITCELKDGVLRIKMKKTRKDFDITVKS